ncbi:GGDEF domain-containing protein [Candidatus Woesearchaeota archaeon]|nr:GGDEF domain-containing protein [Candidatus Woesearchaeota archaeon]
MVKSYKSLRDIISDHDKYERRASNLESSNEYLREELVKWKKKAKYDDLTGLLRRETFNGILKRFITRSNRTNTPLAYVLVDIDHFKKINDNYGHDKGDEVLREVSDILKASVRDTDIATRKFVGRYGGEEIAVVLPNTTNEGAKVVGERIRKKVEDHFKSKNLAVTISAGISNYSPKSSEDESNVVDVLYKTADEKLYDAKKTGRNKVIS